MGKSLGNHWEIVWCEQPRRHIFLKIKKLLIFHIFRPIICKRLISNLFEIVGEIQQLFLTNHRLYVIFQLDISFEGLHMEIIMQYYH